MKISCEKNDMYNAMNTNFIHGDPNLFYKKVHYLLMKVCGKAYAKQDLYVHYKLRLGLSISNTIYDAA